MTFSIWIALLAALAGSYFAAASMVLKSVSRKRLADLLEARGHGDRLEPFLGRVPTLILTAATLRTCLGLVVLLATLYTVETYLVPAAEGAGSVRIVSYLVAFLIAGVLVSIFLVAIPNSWAKYQRERLLVATMPLLALAGFVMWPWAQFLHLADPVVRRISGVDLLDEQQDQDLSDDVLTMVEDHEKGEAVQEEQKEMLEAVFELPNTQATEIMTPRTDIKGIEVSSTLEQVKQAAIALGYSRIPVYEESLDHILGILYVKDLIRHVGNGADFDLRTMLREAFMVPETKSVAQLLEEFKTRKVHIAILVDEYGGTSGLVTIEDILEELVGEIEDEYELNPISTQWTVIDEHTIEADARVDVDDLNDELGLDLPDDDDYDTLGGFVFHQTQRIPSEGESFEYEGKTFLVLDAERTRVNRVRIEGLNLTIGKQATA